MFWQEDENESRANNSVIDVSLYLSGKTLPVDYTWLLAEAVHTLLPWLQQDSATGMYLAIAGEEGNGWFRDDDPDQVIFLPARTRLVIRTTPDRLDDLNSLVGSQLDINGHKLEIRKIKQVSLPVIATLYARHVVAEEIDEDGFLARILEDLQSMNIKCKKMLCGKSRQINTPSGSIATRSLMLADLRKEDAIKLQQLGIGPYRILGCGLFVPHKSITRLDD